MDDSRVAELRAMALASDAVPVADPAELSMLGIRSHLEQTFGKDERMTENTGITPGYARTATARMHGPLTRESRYVPVLGAIIPDGLLRCGSCGSMVAPGGEDLHERLHPRISCERLNCGVYHADGHAWEDQFR
jgi:hypothetical protein